MRAVAGIVSLATLAFVAVLVWRSRSATTGTTESSLPITNAAVYELESYPSQLAPAAAIGQSELAAAPEVQSAEAESMLQAGQGPIPDNCQFAAGPNTWDLSSMKLTPASVGRTYYATFDTKDKYWYYINVCGTVVCKPGVANVAVCQTGANHPETPSHQVGFYDAAPPPYNGSAYAPYWDFINPTQPGYGIKFVLANGDGPCPNGNPRTAHIYFDCDPTYTTITNFTLFVPPGAVCLYEYHIRTQLSCVPGFVPPTASPVGPSSSAASPLSASTGGKKASTGGGFRFSSSTGFNGTTNSTVSGPLISLSPGSWFLVGFGTVSFAYVMFGCIHRRVTYGVVGWDACPNYPFWSVLPSLVADGFRFTADKVRCRAVPSKGYQNVK